MAAKNKVIYNNFWRTSKVISDVVRSHWNRNNLKINYLVNFQFHFWSLQWNKKLNTPNFSNSTYVQLQSSYCTFLRVFKFRYLRYVIKKKWNLHGKLLYRIDEEVFLDILCVFSLSIKIYDKWKFRNFQFSKVQLFEKERLFQRAATVDAVYDRNV